MRLKNIMLLTLGALSTIFCLSSCDDFGDGFLTQSNPKEMNNEIFWKSLDDCQAGLATVYNAFKHSDVYLTVEETKRTDLAWPGTSTTNKFPSANDEYYLQTFNSSTPAIGKKWAAIYKGVFYANQVIAGLEKVKADDPSIDLERWTLLNAQARFFRGLFYFYLNTSFNNGAVPIFDFVPETSEEFMRPCNTSEDVKAFYRMDMEYAEANLPLKGTASDWKAANGDLGRPRSETASAVLGMSYLYDANAENSGNYDKAAAYFNKVISNGSYSLVGAGDNAYTDNELNDESLLEVIYTYDFKSEENAGSVESLTTLINRNFSNVGGWTTIYPAFWLSNSFVSEPVDKRNPVNKVELQRDLHGDIYYSYNPQAAQKIVTLGGEDHLIYPVIARIKDVKSKIKNNQFIFDVHSPEEAPEDTKNTLYSMTWTDSVYVLLKKLKVDSKGEIIAKTRDELTGANEGYELINDNKDMMPTRPLLNDRSLGAIPIYDNTKTSGATMSEQLYDFASSVDEGSPYRYRNRSLRANYSMWTYYDMDSGHYQYLFPGDHGKLPVAATFKKYTNWQTRQTEESMPKADSEINLRLIRLADVYLMYAECLIKGGTDEAQLDEALKYVNRVRYRAGTVLVGKENAAGAEYVGNATYQDTHAPSQNVFKGDYYDLYNDKSVKAPETVSSIIATEEDIIDTAKELMNHLMFRERPLELCLDGHAIRSNDLRRWGVTKERFQYLSSEYAFSTVGMHQFNWETVYDKTTKIITFKKLVKNWAYRFKYLPTDPNFDKYFFVRNGLVANAGILYEFKEPASNYNDTKAYFPIPNDETISNPKIGQIVDRVDL